MNCKKKGYTYDYKTRTCKPKKSSAKSLPIAFSKSGRRTQTIIDIEEKQRQWNSTLTQKQKKILTKQYLEGEISRETFLQEIENL